MKAFFYITNEHRYVREAIRSAQSFKKVNPDDKYILFTPLRFSETHRELLSSFDQAVVLKVPDMSNWWHVLIRYMRDAVAWLIDAGFEKAIYLDVDTYAIENVDDLFNILDYFDFAGIISPRGRSRNTYPEIPRSFPELNIGVNPMRLDKCEMLWRAADEFFDRFGNQSEDYDDQNALHHALWWLAGRTDDMRLAIIPPEYNFRFNFPCFAGQLVKILHGHEGDHLRYESIARIVNRSLLETKGAFSLRAWEHGVK